MDRKTIGELGQAPETWCLLPSPLTLDQMKHLRKLRDDKLIDCRHVTIDLPTYVGMEWRMSREELRRQRDEWGRREAG